jgi:hypothetical protein
MPTTAGMITTPHFVFLRLTTFAFIQRMQWVRLSLLAFSCFSRSFALVSAGYRATTARPPVAPEEYPDLLLTEEPEERPVLDPAVQIRMGNRDQRRNDKLVCPLLVGNSKEAAGSPSVSIEIG